MPLHPKLMRIVSRMMRWSHVQVRVHRGQRLARADVIDYAPPPEHFAAHNMKLLSLTQQFPYGTGICADQKCAQNWLQKFLTPLYDLSFPQQMSRKPLYLCKETDSSARSLLSGQGTRDATPSLALDAERCGWAPCSWSRVMYRRNRYAQIVQSKGLRDGGWIVKGEKD
jgi:hypothetical protein